MINLHPLPSGGGPRIPRHWQGAIDFAGSRPGRDGSRARRLSYRGIVRDGGLYQESIRGDFLVESHRILFGIGSGEHGTSYVVARGDLLFLTPLSYYSQKGLWDLSPGYAAGF
jgi:hypothetical protein